MKYRYTLILVSMLLVLVSAGAWASEPTEEEYREIVVTLHNFRFDPDVIVVAPGEHIRFVVDNTTTMYHTFTIFRSADDREEALVDVPLSSQQDDVILVTMPDEETELYLVCIPHELGLNMVGSIIVTNDPDSVNLDQ